MKSEATYALTSTDICQLILIKWLIIEVTMVISSFNYFLSEPFGNFSYIFDDYI